MTPAHDARTRRPHTTPAHDARTRHPHMTPTHVARTRRPHTTPAHDARTRRPHTTPAHDARTRRPHTTPARDARTLPPSVCSHTVLPPSHTRPPMLGSSVSICATPPAVLLQRNLYLNPNDIHFIQHDANQDPSRRLHGGHGYGRMPQRLLRTRNLRHFRRK